MVNQIDIFNNKIKIPFFRPFITKEDKKEVNKALNSSLLTDGPKLVQFEKNFELSGENVTLTNST